MGHRNWGQKGMALYSISPCLFALQHVHRQSEHPFLLFYFVTVLLSCDGAHVLFRPICKSALMHQVALLLTRQLFSLSLWCCWMAGRTDICMPVWQLVKTINVQKCLTASHKDLRCAAEAYVSNAMMKQAQNVWQSQLFCATMKPPQVHLNSVIDAVYVRTTQPNWSLVSSNSSPKWYCEHKYQFRQAWSFEASSVDAER